MIWFILLSFLSFAETEIYEDFTCGLITRYSANRISKNCLTEATNIQIDDDFAITKHKGFSKFNPTACAGAQSIKGLWQFLTPGGSTYMVIHSSNSMFWDDGAGGCNALTGLTGVLVTTATVNCTQALGYLWCSSKEYGGFRTDINSTQSITGMPRAGQIGTFRNRILVGDIQGEESRVRGSGELDGTDWTVQIPGRSTTPFTMAFGGAADGRKITALMGEYQNAYLVGKAQSIWGIGGYDRRDFSIFRVSEEIGVLDSRTVKEKNNALYWLSHRGIEKMSGTSIQRISDTIRPTIESLIDSPSLTNQSITQDSQADWEGGNLQPSGPGATVSATISPGSVVVSTWQRTDTSGADFGSGTQTNTSTIPVSGSLVYIQGSSATFAQAGAEGGTSASWTLGAGWGSVSDTDPDCSGSSHVQFTGAGSGNMQIRIKNEAGNVLHTNIITVTAGCDNGKFNINTSTWTDHKIRISLILASPGTEMISNPFVRGTGLTYYAYLDNAGGYSFDMDESQEILASTFTSQIFDTTFSSPTGGLFTVNFSSSSDSRLFFRVQASTASDGGGFETVVDQSTYTRVQADDRRYWRYLAYFNNSSSTNTNVAKLDDVTLNAATTGYYISNCFNLQNATRLTDFNTDIANNGGTFSFFVSSAATCAASTQTTQNWVTQNNNAAINLTTATFIGVRALFNIGSSSDTPALQKITLTYQSGTRNLLASEIYKDNYYLFYSTADTTNDHAIIANRNDKFTILEGINAASALSWKGKLYTGDSENSGNIFQQDVGWSYDNADARFIFKTNDNDLGDSTTQKVFDRLYIELKSEGDIADNIPIALTYFIDGSTTSYSLGTVNLDEGDENGYISAEFPFPTDQQNSGRWISFRGSYTGQQGPIKIYKMILYYRKTQNG